MGWEVVDWIRLAQDRDHWAKTYHKHTGTLLRASRKVGLKVRAEKRKYMLVSPPKFRAKS